MHLVRAVPASTDARNGIPGAVTPSAVQSRHEQVHKLWDDMLSSIGVERRNDQ